MTISVKLNPGWVKVPSSLVNELRKDATMFKYDLVRHPESEKLIFIKQRHCDEWLRKCTKDFPHIAVGERIVRINNYLATTYLPEIVDVYYSKLKTVPRINIVKQHFNGFMGYVNLRHCIEAGVLSADLNGKFEEDIIDPFKRPMPRRVKFKMFVERILSNVIEFQSFLFSKGLVHTALDPTHIILQVDYLVKFVGERHIMRHVKGYLHDPSAIDQEKYGPVIVPRYSPDFFIEYVNTGGQYPVNVIGLTSYQIGVLLFDFVTENAYLTQPFTAELVKHAHLRVPFSSANLIREVILQLTDRLFCDNVNSFREIESVLEWVLEG
ncbi:hypothetical protein [Fervidobacterium thailandense]|uniref:Protein kinase domain-containing protein n=1 Tax=Fervidobacterium thailandense TaxID=1008305 RepID=A0A1E3G4K5_9BACT|nr:hypothetical protein [Fervidobacterium thailandense]ODN30773.1 hypothetical protein A4H02_04400 [Fervidobacterium thailandense]